MGSEIKITWMQTTTGSAAAPGVAAAPGEPTESFCVFVGNLNPDMDEKEFRNAFTPFGCIDARMITEPGNPHKKLHYGFVDFADKVTCVFAVYVVYWPLGVVSCVLRHADSSTDFEHVRIH